MNVLVYTGRGASFSKDVIHALRILKIKFGRIDEEGILRGRLESKTTLIVPGGWPQKYSNNLGRKGMKIIKEFVSRGGNYVGICAGAYIASKRFELDKSSYSGIGLTSSVSRMEVRKFLPGRIRKIHARRSFITKGCGKKMKIWYENGPIIISRRNIAAKFENGSNAVLFSKYKKGHVVLFSPHPEGNIKNKIDPVKSGTIVMLKNSIV